MVIPLRIWDYRKLMKEVLRRTYIEKKKTLISRQAKISA